MRLTGPLLASTLLLSACAQKGGNPMDPYEPMNRKIHDFNMAVDATLLKPPAKLYKAVVPTRLRNGINNAYNNVLMLPTVANDLMQGQAQYAITDSWRFLINSTFGLAGFIDIADKRFSLPPHYNDLGLTFAKWGNKNSPYVVIPLLGPSTIRDGVALPFDYLFTPYFYLSGGAITGLAALRYVDLRSQLLSTEPILGEALDKYAFIRDAYLQHRQYQITGEGSENPTLYVDDGASSDYIEETPALPKKTQAKNHVAHHSLPARNTPQHG
ncbi:MAG: VacJ family lipoprotein [Tatlockia sp.]